jgi:hypothetical protein
MKKKINIGSYKERKELVKYIGTLLCLKIDHWMIIDSTINKKKKILR